MADMDERLLRFAAEMHEIKSTCELAGVERWTGRSAVDMVHDLRTRLAAAEAERDRYRSALRDVAREWPYLDLIDPQAVQECDLRGLVEYLLGAVRSEQRVAREALEGHTDA